MSVTKIAAVGLVAGVLTLIVKKTHPELAVPVSLTAGVLMLAMTLDYLKQTVSFVRDFVSSYPLAGEGVTVVLKIIAVGYISEFSSQLLKDAGEGSLAGKVELGGKLCIIVLCLPMLSQFTTLLLGMIPS